MIENYEWSDEDCRRYAGGLRSIIKYNHRPIARKILSYLSDKPNLKILDIATGPGYLLLELSKLMNSPVLIAQDAHKPMLVIATEEAQKYGKTIKLCKCPAEQLTLGDKSVDVVMCKQLLHEAIDAEKVVSEICRVAKPDGKVFIIDFDADGNKVAALLIQGIIRLTGGKEISRGFRKSFKAGLPGKTVVEYLKKYGMKNVEYIKRGADYFIVGYN